MLVDLVGVPLALKSGLYASGAVYGIFFVMVTVGFLRWQREYRSRRDELTATPA
ncbi:nicotinamide mononucleotide transporter [Nocardia sp. NPDC004722]